MQHGPEDPRVSPGLQRAHQNIPGSPERGERNQVGPAGSPARFLLRRHDAQDLGVDTRHMGAQSSSARQRDLHDQVESDRPGHQQPELESYTGQCQLRLDRASVGRGERRVSAHVEQAHRAGLLGRVQPGRQVPRHGLLRQVRQHLEYCCKFTFQVRFYGKAKFSF